MSFFISRYEEKYKFENGEWNAVACPEGNSIEYDNIEDALARLDELGQEMGLEKQSGVMWSRRKNNGLESFLILEDEKGIFLYNPLK